MHKKFIRQTWLILSMILFFSCGQKEKNKDPSDASKDNLTSPKKKSSYQIFNRWLFLTIGNEHPIDSAFINKAGFTSFSFYEKAPYQPLVEKLYFRVNGIVPVVSVENHVINLEYTDQSYNFERLLFQNNRIIHSYHASAGDDGGSYVFNLETNGIIQNDYTIFKVNGDSAEICSDGYDDEGHYWHNGKLNLKTDSIIWGEVEH